VVAEEHQQLATSKLIQCYGHCKEWGGEVVEGPNPLHHHTHQAEVHLQLYIESMCANERSR
jgi:hypothetical protein